MFNLNSIGFDLAKYTLGKEFTQFIAKNTIGYLTVKDLDALLALIEGEFNRYHFTKQTETNFLRILESQFDKTKLISEFLDYPHHLETLTNIAVNSNHLTEILILHPEFINLIHNQNLLNEKISLQKLHEEISRGTSRLKSIRGKINLLKSYKMRYLLKIGVNDLLGNYTLEETTTALSILAKELLSELFLIAYSETQKKYQVELKNDFILLSLGKLGGRELNYSSDVDLMAIYKSNFTISGKEYHELLSETIQQFIAYSSIPDEKGYLYRIDFRLRPDGKSSPLCRTFNDTIHYYESRGEDWERQMLIKMDLLCGDGSMYNEFHKIASKFIFQSYSVSSIKEQTAKMKKAIENNLVEDGNVKLFSGGIRDIEFITQALQMINGKRFNNFFTGNTLEALELLGRHSLISKTESNILRRAYVFYRKTEHYLQLMNDRQTHQLPEDEDTKKRLAMFMGYKSVSSFTTKLNEHRIKVRKIFNSFVGEESTEGKLRFTNIKRAESNLAFLRTGKSLVGSKEFDRKTINLFAKIESSLLNEVEKASNPDDTLERLVLLVKSTFLPSIFYSQCESDIFLKYVVSICSKNHFGIELIKSCPSLIEIIISATFLSEDYDHIIANLNTEQFLLFLSTKVALNLISHKDAQQLLSEFISSKLEELYLNELQKEELIVFGYGSFAINEMHLYSDIDLALFAQDIDKFDSPQAYAISFSKKIKEELYPIEVDFRLRPEGKSSQLLWDFNSYLDYLNHRSRLWELQTILKIKNLNKSSTQTDEIRSILIKRIESFNKVELKDEMLSMYRKIRSGVLSSSRQINFKNAHGGMATIDFIIAYLLFRNLNALKEGYGKDTITKINILSNYYTELKEQLEFTAEWHDKMKNIAMATNILFNRKKPFVNKEDSTELNNLSNFTGINCSVDSIQKHLKTVGDFFNKLFLE